MAAKNASKKNASKPTPAPTSNRGNLAVVVTPTANGNRYTVAGVGLCGLLRWCGANGYTPGQAKTMLNGLGLGEVVSASTVGCQVGSARAEAAGKKAHHPGEVAELPKPVAAALRKLLEA